MVVHLPFIVNFYHDGLFTVNPLEYVHFESRVIDDVSFDDSDLDGETNVSLDDVAHVVEQFEHENKSNVNIPRMTTDDPWLNKLVRNGTFIGQTDNPNPNLQGRVLLEVEDPDDEQVESKFKAKQDVSYPFFNPDTPWNECKPVLGMRDVSEGKCAGLKSKKPKTIDDDECETSKQGSKKGDGRKAVNRTLSKVVKERWNKKKEIKKKGAKQCVLYDHEGGLVDHYSKLWQYRQAILDTNPGFTCVLENEVNDEDRK
ncbi:hypothetical protein Tco_0509719, partial [Tanacetum coccineum]